MPGKARERDHDAKLKSGTQTHMTGVSSLSGRLVDYLVRQPLPGNVREIEAFVVMALKESEDTDDALRLPRSISTSNTTPPPEPPEEEEEMRDRGPDPTKEELLRRWRAKGGTKCARRRGCAGIGR